MLLRLLTLTLLADVVVGPEPKAVPRPPSVCSQDADCVLSTFEGCCGSCCPSPPHAAPRGTNEAARCAVIDCARPRCDAVRCARAPEAVDAYLAICRVGQCVAVRKPVAERAVCRVDADCQVVMLSPPAGAACHQGPCGCCPSPTAVPVDAPVPVPPPTKRRPQSPQAPQSPDGKGPTFGLSTGDGATPARPPPQGPACAPCPGGPSGVRAACIGGQCQLAPRPMPPG
jgi:hypothetical protein